MTDKQVREALRNSLERTFKEKASNIILTGVVRKESQVKMIDDLLAEFGKKVDNVVFFELSDEEAVKRIAGRLYDPETGKIYHEVYNPPSAEVKKNTKLVRRAEDSPEITRKRLERFSRDNEAILKEYKSRSILIKVDASQDIEKVYNDLIKSLDIT